MPPKKKPTVAICYDFDGTLAPGNMQEHNFIPKIGLEPLAFWAKVGEEAKAHDADEILTYMRLMLKSAESAEVPVRLEDFRQYGAGLKLFEGVTEWFTRITEYGRKLDVNVEHFIISSGLKEMIEGTQIAKHFKKIYASAFIYNHNKIAVWPALAVNYTTKTQFLFRINKGQLEVWDNTRINAFVQPDDRPVPFKRMMFIGDGTTDIPCMKLVKQQGGYSIAVYPPNTKRAKAEQLMNEDRVNFVAPADYTEGSVLDRQVQAVIARIAADCVVEQGPKALPPRKARFANDADGNAASESQSIAATVTPAAGEVQE